MYVLLGLDDVGSVDRMRAHVCLREARRIVNGFNDSVSEIAAVYDDSEDTASDPEAAISVDEAEGRQLTIAQNLYDQYLSLVTSVMIRAPMISEVQFDRYEQVILIPCHGISRRNMVQRSLREIFFAGAIGRLVIPALRAARPRM